MKSVNIVNLIHLTVNKILGSNFNIDPAEVLVRHSNLFCSSIDQETRIGNPYTMEGRIWCSCVHNRHEGTTLLRF